MVMLIQDGDVGQLRLVEEIFGGQRDGSDHLDEQLEQESNICHRNETVSAKLQKCSLFFLSLMQLILMLLLICKEKYSCLLILKLASASRPVDCI